MAAHREQVPISRDHGRGLGSQRVGDNVVVVRIPRHHAGRVQQRAEGQALSLTPPGGIGGSGKIRSLLS